MSHQTVTPSPNNELFPLKLTRGVPPVESFPTDKLAECACAALADHGNIALQYGAAGGFPPLRAYLSAQAGVAEEQVIIGQGSLQLLDLITRTLVKPGDAVFVEQPIYDFTLGILRLGGAQITGFPLGNDRPDLDALEERIEEGARPVFYCTIPDFQNPSGVVLSKAKRERLAALAGRYDFYIVEDIPYRRLRYRGEEPPTLFSLAPQRVIQMSSFSKQICPGLRVGYALGPQPLIEKLTGLASATYINPSYLNQAIVYEFIQRGWLEPQIAGLKEIYRARLDAALGGLKAHMSDLASWHEPEGGFFIGVWLKNEALRAADLLEAAAKASLTLTDGRGFFPHKDVENFIRLPFCALTPQELEMAIARLAGVVRAL